MNMQHACYNALNKNINNVFKVSNNPFIVDWNPIIELCNIFDQMTATYSHPTLAAILQNDMLFRSVYSPLDAPKIIFQCSRDCQEVQTLGEDHTQPSKCSTMQCGCCCSAACTPVKSTIGTKNPPQRRFGPTSRLSFKKHTPTI